MGWDLGRGIVPDGRLEYLLTGKLLADFDLTLPRTSEAGNCDVPLPLRELDREVFTGAPWTLWVAGGGGSTNESLL